MRPSLWRCSFGCFSTPILFRPPPPPSNVTSALASRSYTIKLSASSDMHVYRSYLLHPQAAQKPYRYESMVLGSSAELVSLRSGWFSAISAKTGKISSANSAFLNAVIRHSFRNGDLQCSINVETNLHIHSPWRFHLCPLFGLS